MPTANDETIATETETLSRIIGIVALALVVVVVAAAAAAAAAVLLGTLFHPHDHS